MPEQNLGLPGFDLPPKSEIRARNTGPVRADKVSSRAKALNRLEPIRVEEEHPQGEQPGKKSEAQVFTGLHPKED